MAAAAMHVEDSSKWLMDQKVPDGDQDNGMHGLNYGKRIVDNRTCL